MTRKLALHYNPQNAAAGAAWYALARETARRLSRTYRVTLRRAAAVIAVLSPRCTWRDNVRAAELVLSGASGTMRALGANVDKARRIIAGEMPDRVLSGPKVRAFYRGILGYADAVVVDTWIARAAGFKGAITPRTYARIARAVERLAREVGAAPASVQAAIWITIRGSAE